MNLTVSIAQIEVATSQPEVNLRKGRLLIAEAARRGSDVVCFPEMWTTSFNWANNGRMAAEWPPNTERPLIESPVWQKATLSGPTDPWPPSTKMGKSPILPSYSTQREREPQPIRKKHLFSLLGKEKHVAAGKTLGLAETPWGLTGLSVCYDIRFPEFFGLMLSRA